MADHGAVLKDISYEGLTEQQRVEVQQAIARAQRAGVDYSPEHIDLMVRMYAEDMSTKEAIVALKDLTRAKAQRMGIKLGSYFKD